MKLGEKLTKFASAMIVWCMLSTSLMGLLLIAVPSDVQGADVPSVDVTIDSSNPLYVKDGIYVLGHNLTIRSGGVAIFENCQIHVTQNYDLDPSVDLMYYITVEDGGRLIIVNSTVTNKLDTQNQAAPGLGIIVRNGATMFVDNSTLAFPGHLVVDNARLVMTDSVVKGGEIVNCDPTYFPTSFFNDAPVMMFISADVQIYDTMFLDTFDFDNTGWDNTPDLYNFNYPFASDDSERNIVTYSLERNVEGAAALSMDDGSLFAVTTSNSIATTGVDIAGLSFDANEVASITMYVEYSTAYPYAGTSDVFSYILPNGTEVQTGITVTQTWTTPTANTEVVGSETLDLVTYPMSSVDLANTIVSYTNTKAETVNVDRIWFEVALNYPTYKNITLAGNTTFLAVNSVLNIDNGNYDDVHNITPKKLQIMDQAQAYLYGTTILSEIEPFNNGTDPIICVSEST
ncbi:MAG: hypothetical protein LLG16_00075, partial [Euryarchaeota archaeon]|nr:hypothetical protein [Euryarchaeota archaeon]